MNLVCLTARPALPDTNMDVAGVLALSFGIFLIVGFAMMGDGYSEDARLKGAWIACIISLVVSSMLAYFIRRVDQKRVNKQVEDYLASEIKPEEYTQFRQLSAQDAQIKMWVSEYLCQNQKLTYRDAVALQQKINAYIRNADKRELLNLACEGNPA